MEDVILMVLIRGLAKPYRTRNDKTLLSHPSMVIHQYLTWLNRAAVSPLMCMTDDVSISTVEIVAAGILASGNETVRDWLFQRYTKSPRRDCHGVMEIET